MRQTCSVAALAITIFIAAGCHSRPTQSEPPQPSASAAQQACPPYKDPSMHYDASPIVDAIDTNHDGKMTHDEWIAAGAPQDSWKAFMKKDPSHKGYITRQEFLADHPPDGIDFNCDGKITIEEFRRFASQGPKGPPNK